MCSRLRGRNGQLSLHNLLVQRARLRHRREAKGLVEGAYTRLVLAQGLMAPPEEGEKPHQMAMDILVSWIFFQERAQSGHRRFYFPHLYRPVGQPQAGVTVESV